MIGDDRCHFCVKILLLIIILKLPLKQIRLLRLDVEFHSSGISTCSLEKCLMKVRKPFLQKLRDNNCQDFHPPVIKSSWEIFRLVDFICSCLSDRFAWHNFIQISTKPGYLICWWHAPSSHHILLWVCGRHCYPVSCRMNKHVQWDTKGVKHVTSTPLTQTEMPFKKKVHMH